jgi:transcriptional regulator with XRE-family HTH domain
LISPYVRRLRLAAELRALRAEASLTHEQLAAKIGQSRAQISRLENGHVVDQNDVMTILDVLGIEGDRWTEIMTIAREAGERGWWESNRAMGERQARCADLEAGAKTIREFQMTFVPGLLQTPQFTRARAEADRRGGPVDYQPEKVVEGRISRQRMLRRPGGPTYGVIIDEVAVRRRAAPAEVVKEQMYNLTATVNGSPTISVQVLPVNARIDDFAVPRSAFSIYTFADPADPAVVTVDTITDDLVLTDFDDVAMYEGLFARLSEAALSVGESLDFLIGHAKDLRP